MRNGDGRWWLLFGASAGLGVLNKPSMTFFLLSLLVALLLTPQRRLLWNKWSAAGVVLLLLLALPNLLWQMHHHWPTLEFLRNGQAQHKNIALSPPAFLGTQILNMQPTTILIWDAGLVWLLRNPLAKSWRWLGWMFLIFLAVMMALHAKDYYFGPVYPVLFAAGGVAWSSALRLSDASLKIASLRSRSSRR